MKTVGDVRKSLEQSFAELFAVLSQVDGKASDLEENRDEILKRVESYTVLLVDFRKLLQEHPEMRVGNILNAMMEGDVLLSDEGKGLLPDLRKAMNADNEKVNQLVGGIRQRHETMVKFLEAESKIEIK